MIGKAKAISHGINNLRYIMGESANKKHPEKIDFIYSQHLPKGLDALGVWESMQASLTGHDNLKNSLIRIELSPAKEDTEYFNSKDWKELWKDFIDEFDKQVIRNESGKVTSAPTNLAGSKGVVYIHRDSKGGVPHLHGGFCRVDEDGNVNNDHEIHLRAQRAAEAVAQRRGWTTAMKVRTKNAASVTAICVNTLKDMPEWSWDDFVERIEEKGYQVKTRKDTKGCIRGYVIAKDKAKYKASELGNGRSLTYSRLASTWQGFHPVTTPLSTERPVIRQTMPETKMSRPPKVTAAKPVPPKQDTSLRNTDLRPVRQVSYADYDNWTPDRSPVDIDADGIKYHLYLPKNVLKLFSNEFDYRVVENWKELSDFACALFAALISPDVTVSSCGGSTNESGWGRDKDEDDLEFARRCALMAKSKFGLKKKSKGLHK